LFDAKPLLSDGKVFAVSLHAKDITDKVDELNKDKSGSLSKDGSQKPQDGKDWIENIYPNLKEIKSNVEIKLMVNKLS